MASFFHSKEQEIPAVEAVVEKPDESFCPGKDTVCKQVIKEKATIRALVVLTPVVELGEVKSKCIGEPYPTPCKDEPNLAKKCRFIVNQDICVQIPISFTADVSADLNSISCASCGGPLEPHTCPLQPK